MENVQQVSGAPLVEQPVLSCRAVPDTWDGKRTPSLGVAGVLQVSGTSILDASTMEGVLDTVRNVSPVSSRR